MQRIHVFQCLMVCVTSQLPTIQYSQLKTNYFCNNNMLPAGFSMALSDNLTVLYSKTCLKELS